VARTSKRSIPERVALGPLILEFQQTRASRRLRFRKKRGVKSFVRQINIDVMKIHIAADRAEMGHLAAAHAADVLRRRIAAHGSARLVACTGSSQFEVLESFTASDLAWDKIEMFHLDEYAGIAESHPASFRKFLRERLVEKTGIPRYHFLNGEVDPEGECARVGRLIAAAPVDLAFVGIGENGHLAFNDPPADFSTEEPYIVVDLDDACRRQQVGEGWFATVDDVPRRALSMSVRQILKANEIICSCPDARKASAVKACLEGPVSNFAPASILRTHPNVTMYLDRESAGLLRAPGN
jgi:glucosamine-6-phosphate deaminase